MWQETVAAAPDTIGGGGLAHRWPHEGFIVFDLGGATPSL